MFAFGDFATPRLHPEGFSDWNCFVLLIACVERFVSNCRLKATLRINGPLTVEELTNAERLVIQTVQRESFVEYHQLNKQNISSSSKLCSLNPFIDEVSLMHVGGCLQHADYLPYDFRCQIILPRNAWVTKLLVKREHE